MAAIPILASPRGDQLPAIPARPVRDHLRRCRLSSAASSIGCWLGVTLEERGLVPSPPLIADLLVFLLHRRPGDLMSDLFLRIRFRDRLEASWYSSKALLNASR